MTTWSVHTEDDFERIRQFIVYNRKLGEDVADAVVDQLLDAGEAIQYWNASPDNLYKRSLGVKGLGTYLIFYRCVHELPEEADRSGVVIVCVAHAKEDITGLLNHR